MTQPDHTPAAPHVDDNQLIAERRAKLAALREAARHGAGPVFCATAGGLEAETGAARTA